MPAMLTEDQLQQIRARWAGNRFRWTVRRRLFTENGLAWEHFGARPDAAGVAGSIGHQRPQGANAAVDVAPLFEQLEHYPDDVAALLAHVSRQQQTINGYERRLDELTREREALRPLADRLAAERDQAYRVVDDLRKERDQLRADLIAARKGADRWEREALQSRVRAGSQPPGEWPKFPRTAYASAIYGLTYGAGRHDPVRRTTRLYVACRMAEAVFNESPSDAADRVEHDIDAAIIDPAHVETLRRPPAEAPR